MSQSVSNAATSESNFNKNNLDHNFVMGTCHATWKGHDEKLAMACVCECLDGWERLPLVRRELRVPDVDDEDEARFAAVVPHLVLERVVEDDELALLPRPGDDQAQSWDYIHATVREQLHVHEHTRATYVTSEAGSKRRFWSSPRIYKQNNYVHACRRKMQLQ